MQRRVEPPGRVEHGADLEARDGIHHGTPLGWAEHTAAGSAMLDLLRDRR